MSNLYEITKTIQSLFERAIDETTGEVLDAALDAELDKLEGERDARALDIACAIIDLDAEADKIATRADELYARSKVLRNRAESLRRYIARSIPAGHKAKDDRVSLSWRKSEVCVLDVEPHDLAPRFSRIEYKPLTMEIKEALKAGDPLAAEYAHLETRQNLQVK